MKKKLLIRVVVVFVIAAALFFLGSALPVLTLPVWTYLVFMVWKRKTTIFRDQMEPESAERRLRWLRTLLLVAGLSLLVGIVGVILHNVLSAQSGVEEQVFFFIALAGLFVFVIATTGGLVIFLRGRREWAREIWERLVK